MHELADLKDGLMQAERHLQNYAREVVRDRNLHSKGRRQILADSVKLKLEIGQTHLRIILSYAGEDFWMSMPYSSLLLYPQMNLVKYLNHRVTALVSAIP